MCAGSADLRTVHDRGATLNNVTESDSRITLSCHAHVPSEQISQHTCATLTSPRCELVTHNADHWSARDDYASREYSFVEEAAVAHHVRIEDVLHAIDEDIHENGGAKRAADAVPTKPRPFYD